MITLHALDKFFLSSIGEWRLHIVVFLLYMYSLLKKMCWPLASHKLSVLSQMLPFFLDAVHLWSEVKSQNAIINK